MRQIKLDAANGVRDCAGSTTDSQRNGGIHVPWLSAQDRFALGQFRVFIEKGRWAQRMDIVQVAKRANVSTATVSRVLNGFPGVREKTAQRVRRAVAEMNYVPNPNARSLR